MRRPIRTTRRTPSSRCRSGRVTRHPTVRIASTSPTQATPSRATARPAARARWSSAAVPTCTSPPASRRASGSTAPCARCADCDRLLAGRHRDAGPVRSSATSSGSSSSATSELDIAYALPGRHPVPGQRLPAARLVRRGLPGHPAQDPQPGRARPARISRRASRTCPAASCWSPARPARARRPRWPACSTWRTGPASAHIVTIEDPIEFLHAHKQCVVNQREVGVGHRATSPTALKHVLRQDPDIILVGELRDLETTSIAVTAAETGHLVLATLHTQSRGADHRPGHRHLPAAPAAADPRPAGQLPAGRGHPGAGPAHGRQRAARSSARSCSPPPAIRNLIREGKYHQIPSFLQSSARRRHDQLRPAPGPARTASS